MNTQAVEKTDLPGEATSAPTPVTPLVATLPEAKKAAAPAKPQVRARVSAPRKAAAVAKTAPAPKVAASVKAKAVIPAAKPSTKTPAKAASKPTRKVAAAQPAPKAELARNDKAAKPKKAKLVRDSFTMPQSEYDLIASIKKRCMANGFSVKKSEVLRAAVIRFSALDDKQLTAALAALDVIKTGRPPKGQK